MTPRPDHPERISSELIDTIAERLARNQRVRRFLPEEGYVHLERRLPFLCLYRRPPDRKDEGTASLIAALSAHLVAPGGGAHLAQLRALVARMTSILGEAFGAVLLVEVWTAEREETDGEEFTVVAPLARELPAAVGKLVEALEAVPTPNGPARVGVRRAATVAPPSLSRLLPREHLRRFAVLPVGLEIRPFFRDPEIGTAYPRALRDLQRSFSTALQRAFYEFMRLETTHRPPNYQVLGRGAVLKLAWEADRQLAEVGESFDLLLAVTPYDQREAWVRFRDSGFEKEPAFRYRLLTFDPALLKRRLYNIEMDPLEDPALADLFRDKRNELDLQLTMLESRNTSRFLYAGLQLYGRTDGRLLKLAEGLLAGIPPGDGEGAGEEAGGGKVLDAEAFAELARREIAGYAESAPDFRPGVEIRDDLSSLTVSKGDLLIPCDTRLTASRASALIHHEVGTHMLTYFNGGRQPLRLLRSGLPRYDELQEGLAVLAEYLVGGLGHARLRLLAARVLACHLCVDGAGFLDTFRRLHHEHGFSAPTAFHVTTRVYRGGGFVKDQVYLRGLARLLRHLEAGGPFRPLWIGKIGFQHLKVIQELLWRKVLRPPVLEPRHLRMEDARVRLEELRRSGTSVLDLVTKEEAWTSASS